MEATEESLECPFWDMLSEVTQLVPQASLKCYFVGERDTSMWSWGQRAVFLFCLVLKIYLSILEGERKRACM